ncbi:hypothetical protein [Laspinema sp. D2d]|uniref:hypothetical protein n=1 Tax=Laspinema sp. D2d TaxID=2953686 RepID=UPI0021BB2FBA|nr:hypothetical protein [Laspinema sp. D2d]
MTTGAECNQIVGAVVLGHPVMVMNGQSDFGPFRFGEVFGRVPGAEALAATFRATPSGFFFDG